MSNLKQSKIKHGLDNVNKKNKAKNVGNRSKMYSEPKTLSDYNARIEGLSIGLAGFGVSQAYKKIVNLKQNTITHDNFVDLLSEAVYLVSLGQDQQGSVNKLIKENDQVLNVPKFKQYINLLNAAHETATSRSKYPDAKSRETANGDKEKHSKNDSNLLKERYVTSNPAVIKIRSKISTINKSGQKPKGSYKVYSTDQDISSQTSMGSYSGKKVMIAKIEPVVNTKKNLGKIHSENDFEIVNDLLLVEV